MKQQKTIYILLLLVAALQVTYFFPKVPECVASHFDGAGRPNGWMPKGLFVAVYAGVLALLALVFVAAPRYLLRFPDSMINLPHKEYWLSEGHREEASRSIQRCMLEFGNATMAFMICTFQLVFQANLSDRILPSGPVWTLIALFVAFTIWWIVRFYRAFRVR